MDCVICGGKDFSAWGRQGAYEILQCRACGLGVPSPAPSAQQLSEYNLRAYRGEERAAVYASRREEFEKRYEAQIARIKHFQPGGALLDIGCNIGMFMKASRSRGFAVTGVEVNAGCAVYGRENFGLDIRSCSLEGADFPPETFDVVTVFDVLEHVPDPRAFLSAAGRVLKPGGLLVVQSPNFNSFMAWLLKGNWNWLTPPDHLYHFTPGALESLLGAHGFSVREVRTWEPAADFIGNIFSGLPARGSAGRALRKLLWLAGIVFIPLLQRLWWEIKKGGLIEVYAEKTGS